MGIGKSILGLGAVLIAYANYATYRPWGTLIHLPLLSTDSLTDIDLDKMCHSVPNYLGDLTGYLPQFLHTFGFSMMLIQTTDDTNSSLKICSSWTLLNLSIETGQYFNILPGTYDPKDVFAIIAGGALSYGIEKFTTRKKSLEEQIQTSVSS